MIFKLIVITYCISTDLGRAALEATPTNKGPTIEETAPGELQSTEHTLMANVTDIIEVEEELLDSHEAMNKRHSTPKRREKRSFEFLMGLINNNSKYEVLRSDPSSLSAQTSKENSNQSATQLLLELISKIATYPDHWNKVHQLLRNIDEDLSNSENILKKQNWIQTQHTSQSLKRTDFQIMDEDDKTNQITSSQIPKNFIEKWPQFEELNDENSTAVNKEQSMKTQAKTNDRTYQKNFTYHKVTVSGNPARFKKNTTAYVAVSAASPKSFNSQSEEDFMLETELHRLKPWRNKSRTGQMSKPELNVA